MSHVRFFSHSSLIVGFILNETDLFKSTQSWSSWKSKICLARERWRISKKNLSRESLEEIHKQTGEAITVITVTSAYTNKVLPVWYAINAIIKQQLPVCSWISKTCCQSRIINRYLFGWIQLNLIGWSWSLDPGNWRASLLMSINSFKGRGWWWKQLNLLSFLFS